MWHNWLLHALAILAVAAGTCASRAARADEPPATNPPAAATDPQAVATDKPADAPPPVVEKPHKRISDDNAVLGMDRNIAWTGAYGFGNRFGRSGQQVLTRVEGGAYWLTTRYGNRAGMAGGAELGFDGLAQAIVAPTADQDSALSHFLFDLWFGFPVTIIEFGEGDDRWFTTAIEPGVGFSDKHAYAYIKGRLAIRPTERFTLEGSWQWTPFNASGILGSWAQTGAGLDIATLRVAGYYKVTDKKAYIVTFDWRQSTLNTPQAAVSGDAIQIYAQSPYNSNAFSHLDQIRVDNNFRVGIGLAW